MAERFQATMEQRNIETREALSKAMSVQLKAESMETVRKIGMVVDEEVARINARLEQHDKEIAELKAVYQESQKHIATLEEKQKQQDGLLVAMAKKLEALEVKSNIEETKVGNLEKGLSKDMELTHDDITWDRAPDLTVLRLNTESHVQKRDLHGVLQQHWQAHLGEQEWVLQGSETGASQRWTIRFRGPNTATAARRANKAYQLQRGDDGKWIDLQCKTPTGDMAKVHISKDKSPKQQKMEMYTKRLHRSICTLLHDTPDFKIYRDLMGGV
eukprot:3419039-Karenia_brevis.AAC.1